MSIRKQDHLFEALNAMDANVDKLCQLLVRRGVHSAEAVQEMLRRWQKETSPSGNARDFAKWLVARQYVTREQLSQSNRPNSASAAANPSPPSKERGAAKNEQTIPLKEPKRPPAPVPKAKPDLPGIDVEPVSMEDLGILGVSLAKRNPGRDLLFLLGGFVLGAATIGLLWIMFRSVS